MSALFHPYLCGRIAAEWLINMKKKRFLSALLAFAMVLSMCPAGLFGHAHAADNAGSSTTGDTTISILGSNNPTKGAYSVPTNFWNADSKYQGNKGDHGQILYSPSYHDGDDSSKTIGDQTGNYITKLEFILSGEYSVDTVPTEITVKIGSTTTTKFVGDSNNWANEYLQTTWTEVFTGKPKIVHNNTAYDVMVIELTTPYKYTGGYIVVDVQRTSDNNTDLGSPTTGQIGFNYFNVSGGGAAIGCDQYVKGWMPQTVFTFSNSASGGESGGESGGTPDTPVTPDSLGNETTVRFDANSGFKSSTVTGWERAGAYQMPINLWGGGDRAQMVIAGNYYNSGETGNTIVSHKGQYLTKLEFPMSGKYNDLTAVNNTLANAGITVKIGTTEKTKLHDAWVSSNAYESYAIKSGLTDVEVAVRMEDQGETYDVLVVEFKEPFLYDGNDNLVIEFNKTQKIDISPNSGSKGYQYVELSEQPGNDADQDNSISPGVGADNKTKNWLPVTIFTFAEEGLSYEYDASELVQYTDGTPKSPNVVVRDNAIDEELIPGTHYIVRYVGREDTVYPEQESPPTEAGKYIMILDFDTANNGYTGVKEINFILELGFNVTVEITNNNMPYNGKPQTPTVVVKKGDQILTDRIDYYIRVNGDKDCVNAGNYSVMVYEMRNGSVMSGLGVKEVTFTIEKAENDVVASIESWNYGDKAPELIWSASYDKGAVITYHTEIYDAETGDLVFPELHGKPSDAGYYLVQIVIPESENYEEGSALTDFYIYPQSVDGTIKVDKEHTVNNGTDEDVYVPINPYKETNHSQLIVPAADLESLVGKDITALTFYLTGTTSQQIPLKVMMGPTDDDDFALGKGFLSTDSMTTVFNGAVTFKGNTMVLTFDEPYHYDGGNLLLDFSNSGASQISNLYFYGVKRSTSDPRMSLMDMYGNASNAQFIPKMSFAYQSTDPAVTVEQKSGEKLVSDGTAKVPTLIVMSGSNPVDPSGYTVNYVGVTVEYNSPEAPKLAGTYKAVLTFSGNLNGTKEVQFVVEQGDALLNFTIKGWHVGEDANAPDVTLNSSEGALTFEYCARGTGEYTTEVPTAAGKYTLKVTSAANNNYPEIVAYKDFEIEDHKLEDGAAQQKTCTQDGWDAYVFCSKCEYSTQVIQKTEGHALVHHDALEPSCTVAGHLAYDTCENCNYTTYQAVAPTDHTDQTGKNDMPDGICDNCQERIGDWKEFDQGTMVLQGVQKGTYTASVRYGNNDTIILKLGSKEFFSIDGDGKLKLCGYQVEGIYEIGTYEVKLTVNPVQKMAMLEVKLPDGTVIRRGTYELLDGSDSYTIMAGAYDTQDVFNNSIGDYGFVDKDSYSSDIPDEAPTSGDIFYNLTTSFNDARYERAFAWTMQSSWIGSSDMVIRYGLNDAFVGSGTKADKVVGAGGETYFKVDITDLQPGQTYYYQIGKADGSTWSKTYTFTTADVDSNSFNFAVVGDTHATGGWTNSQYTYAALQKALSGNTAFLLHTGDLVDTGSNAAEWNEFFATLGNYGSSTPIFAAIGNHDYYNVGNGNNHFFNLHFNNPDRTLSETAQTYYNTQVGNISSTGDGTWLKPVATASNNETFYSFDYGNAHFIVLNSGNYGNQDEYMLEAQRQWLIEDLNVNKHAQWTVVMMHQPGYHRNDDKVSRPTLNDVFEEYGVDLVIQGHSHLVTRTYPVDEDGNLVKDVDPGNFNQGTGTVYITVGGTIVGNNSKGEPNHDSMGDPNFEEMMLIVTPDLYQPTYTNVAVTDGKLTVTIKQLDGLEVDTFTINADTSKDVEHDYEIVEVIREETCTETGLYKMKCTGCDYTEIHVEDADGHTISYGEAKTPTCTEEGWQAYEYCQLCDYTTKVIDNALGHTAVDDLPVAATCTTSGLKRGQHCSVCSEVLVAQAVVTAKGHTYERSDFNGEPVFGWNENDTPVSATATFTCTDCEEGRETIATKVVKDEVHSTEGNCHTAAKNVYTATVTLAGKPYTDEYHITAEIDPDDHDWGEWEDAGDGYHERKCTVSWIIEGEFFWDEDETVYCDGAQREEHTCTSEDTKEPTCTEPGIRTYICTAEGCDYSYTEDISADGASHSFSTEWTSNGTNHWHACQNKDCPVKSGEDECSGGDSSCTQKAICETCGNEYGELDDHVMTHYEAQAPSCTADGTVEYWSCSVCEKNYADEDGTTVLESKVDPANGHTYGDPDWSWTEDENGGYTAAAATFTCSCEHEETVTASEIDVSTTPATATENGKTVYTASVEFGGTTYTDTKEVTIPATGEPEEPTGVTVTGSAVSWNNSDDAIYLLYKSTVEDATIKAEWAAENPEFTADYNATNTKSGITAVTVDSKAMQSQTFTFEGVAAGTYKLVILKPGKYVPKIVEITVGDSAVDVGQQKLWLYGDVNYDGSVLANDSAQITRYVNGLGSVFGNGDEQTKADRLLAADVNRDGSVLANDAAQITRFVNGLGSAFNTLD